MLMPLCFKCRMKAEYREETPEDKQIDASRNLRVGEKCDLCEETITIGMFEYATPLIAGRGWRCHIDESRCEHPYCNECEKAMKKNG